MAGSRGVKARRDREVSRFESKSEIDETLRRAISMEVAFKDASLDRLETDASFKAGFGNAVVKAYRKRMQQIRAATDERTFYAHRSFHFEKLQGDREGQYSMRLNDQWRLIIELHGESPRKTVHVIEIVDYH
jgi:proteic killer suppression protein